MAGLLTYSPFALPSRSGKIETVADEWAMVYGAYSCGTVPDLHRIPF